MRIGSLFPQGRTLAPTITKEQLNKAATEAVAAGPAGRIAAVLDSKPKKPGEFLVKWPKTPIQQPKDYRIITKADDLIQYLKKCEVTGYGSWDYETAPDKEERERWAAFLADWENRAAICDAKHMDDVADATDELPEGKERAAKIKAIDKQYDQDVKAFGDEYKEREKDFLATPLDPWRSDICAASISAWPDESRVIFIEAKGSKLFEPSLPRDEARKLAMDIFDRYLFRNPKIMKVSYNLQFESKYSLKYGKYILMPVADPFLMLIRCMQLVLPKEIENPKRPYTGKSLKKMTRRWLNVVMTEFKTLLDKHKVQFFDELDTDDPDAALYSAEDSDYGLQQYLYWVEIAKQIPDYYDWLHDIEMPFARVIGQMEYWGLPWDKQTAQLRREEASIATEEAAAEIKNLAQQLFNVDINPGKSGKTNDIHHLVFELMKLPVAGLTDAKEPSLDKEALLDIVFMLENKLHNLDEEKALAVELPEGWEEMDPETDPNLGKSERMKIRIMRRSFHPYKDEGIKLCKLLQKIQKYATLLSAHVDGREVFLNPRSGRIHAHYSPWTETSRLNSFEPNGQNVPRPDNDDLQVRGLFPALPGRIMGYIDFSGFELRLQAWQSGDEVMLDLFNHSGDMHKRTACTLTGKPPEAITKPERTAAKAGNFLISYGGTEHALQGNFKTQYGIRKSLEECKAIIDAVFHTYPRIKPWQREKILEARERGYAETIYGYKRILRYINSPAEGARMGDERRACNTPIQGSAADIMKKSQNTVYEKTGQDTAVWYDRVDLEHMDRLAALEDLILVHGYTDMVAQIHDEMLLDMIDDKKVVSRAMHWIKAEMEKPPLPVFPVKIEAEASVGYVWNKKKALDAWIDEQAA